MQKIITGVIIALSLSIPLSSVAETTRYVTDELEITMRTGQGVKFGIRRMLPSGTKLAVIETDSEGYSKVRTGTGVEGWVLTRYLSNISSARDRLAASEKKTINLELAVAKYKKENRTLSAQKSTAVTENTTLKATSQRLTKELDNLRRTASSTVSLDNENRQLKQQLQKIDDEIQLLIIENSALKSSETRSWFMVGAAVLLLGLILGLVLPRLRLNRKDSWGSL